MLRLVLILICVFFTPFAMADGQPPVGRIAFGSCLKQDRAQPVWEQMLATRPDAFLFMGDNVYIDSTDPQVMREQYRKLGGNAGFRQLRSAVPVLPVWDDHDYGRNDSGREFPARQQSKDAFLEFFGIPQNDPRRQREGLYAAYSFEQGGKKVQVIMLDTRWFRDFPPVQSGNQQATILGDVQWKWLEKQLQEPADLRLLVSSIQVIPVQHEWEKWANFPAERTKLLKLLQDTRANGVILLSGDRHIAEISVLKPHESGLAYPLYEITASGLNSAIGWLKGEEENRYRLGRNYRADHFGLLEIDWQQTDPLILAQIRDAESGKTVLEQKLRLSELQP